MSDPLVFICKKGSITQPSKVAMREAGILVVEADDPDNCRLMRGREVISGSDMASAAVAALTSEGWQTSGGSINALGRANQTFVAALAEMLKANKA